MSHTRPASRTDCEKQQADVTDYFESSTSYWNDIYSDKRLWPLIYRERQAIALRWIEHLELPRSAQILEIGCGAGFLSVALAERGYSVDAMDVTTAMLEVARHHAEASNVGNRIRFEPGDAHQLRAPANAYDLVIALGVIPWLHTEDAAVREIARILKRGGYALITADNNARLNRLLDPVSTPLFKPLRLPLKWLLKKMVGHIPEPPLPRRHYPGELDHLLQVADLRKMKCGTIGFGVVTLGGKQIIPSGIAAIVHQRLQKLASAGVFPFNKTGIHYMVLSRKPESDVLPEEQS